MTDLEAPFAGDRELLGRLLARGRSAAVGEVVVALGGRGRLGGGGGRLEGRGRRRGRVPRPRLGRLAELSLERGCARKGRERRALVVLGPGRGRALERHRLRGGPAGRRRRLARSLVARSLVACGPAHDPLGGRRRRVCVAARADQLAHLRGDGRAHAERAGVGGERLEGDLAAVEVRDEVELELEGALEGAPLQLLADHHHVPHLCVWIL
mmetsp:Transcript_17338/g.56751  ORF Transcript_17338/g.56751 Transcript_17338/m.56751 type:complete len:211 (-) Transcript_17338:3-635(-)